MNDRLKQKKVFWVLWFTLLLNLCNCGLKLVVGAVSHNLTVMSDAVHGLLDALNNVVGMFAINIAWRPPQVRGAGVAGHRRRDDADLVGDH